MPGDVGRSAWRGRISRSESLARPPILSYAQNAEDVVLSRAFADQEFGFYVDIGACHPVEDSVTLHFYERGWHGVNVEPDRELHALFLEARPRDTNLCAAVGRPRGRVAFHPTGTRGHGTLDATLASARCAGRPAERVPAMLLSDVIDCHGPDEGEIDFLKIDVEGWEAGVIASGDWTRHRPRVLVIEAVDDKPGHQVNKTRRCRNGVSIRVMNLRSQPKLKLPNRIGVSPARCKSVSSVGDATAQPAIAQLRAPWNGGRLGVSGPLISSKAFSLLPSSLRNSR